MPEPVILAYFARHGSTALNDANCFRGAMNPHLNDSGKQDAEELASYFQPIQLSAIFYSDKHRTTSTAQAIAKKQKNIPMFGTPALWAWNVGMFSGKEKTPENQAKLDEYVANPDRPIPDGESLNGFKARVRPVILESLEIANQAGAPTLNVVHSSIIHEIGDMINRKSTSTLVEPGGVAAICEQNGRLFAKPLIKPNLTKIGSRADTVS